MSTLQIQLFGEFRLIYAGTEVTTVNQARMQSLLAYLVLHRAAPQARQRLAFLFWPDSTDAQARTNLRQLLYRLQRTLPEAEQFLQITANTVQWRPAADFSLDVAEFEQVKPVKADSPIDNSGFVRCICKTARRSFAVTSEESLSQKPPFSNLAYALPNATSAAGTIPAALVCFSDGAGQRTA